MWKEDFIITGYSGFKISLESNKFKLTHLRLNGQISEKEKNWIESNLIKIFAESFSPPYLHQLATQTDIIRWKMKVDASSGPKEFIVCVIKKQYLEQQLIIQGVYVPDKQNEELASLKSDFVSNQMKLTKREKEILLLILEAMDNEEIANKLYIAKNTVDNHRSKIYQKLQVHSFKELIKKVV
jgi:DNA-binding CsgD family transcriptional regulator